MTYANYDSTLEHKHCLQPGCDFDAPNLNALDKHLKEDHFQCEGCRIVFPSQNKLAAHAEGCSFNIPCQQCGEVFPGQVNLAVHQESCFMCSECGYRTTHVGNYQIVSSELRLSNVYLTKDCST